MSEQIPLAKASPGALARLSAGQICLHAAMAGKTDVLIGYWHDFIHVPIAMATESRRKVLPDSLLWNSVLSATGQRAGMI